jgi:predicted Zn-dependent protease
MPSEKRLEMLEKVVASGHADSFALYGLALEYQAFGRTDDALRTFKTLRGRDPSYVAMYLMCGTMLTRAGRPGEAREWLESGILQARTKGDQHAQRELETALEGLPPPPSIA